jgi:predicted O-methyltransferase YrrM
MPSDLPGLSFAKFSELYGGSFRTKHVLVVPRTIGERLRLAVRFLAGRVDTANKRTHSASPRASKLPPDFIRLDPWEAEYLYLSAQRARLGIVEIGRFHGGSTFLLACANRQVPIWSIDLDPADDDRLRGFFAGNDVGGNVELIVGDSQRDSFSQIGGYDVLFVDGDHTYEGCSADLRAFVPRLAEGGELLLHDCYAEMPVQRAVIDFVAGSDLTVIRSPHIPRSHWQTPYGSLAHFAKPSTTAATRAVHALHPRLVAAAVALLTLIFCLFALLPEELGDKPYNVF